MAVSAMAGAVRSACTARLLKVRRRLRNFVRQEQQNNSVNAQREWGGAPFTLRGRGVRSESITAMLAASLLKQSLGSGAMRDESTVSIDGVKGKKGIQDRRQVLLQALYYLSIGVSEARWTRGRCERCWPT